MKRLFSINLSKSRLSIADCLQETDSFKNSQLVGERKQEMQVFNFEILKILKFPFSRILN